MIFQKSKLSSEKISTSEFSVPTITAIKPQKIKGRYNIYLNGKFSFGVDEELLLQKNLRVKKNVTPREIDRYIKESELGKLYQKTLHFLSFRPRSEKEVYLYLKKKMEPHGQSPRYLIPRPVGANIPSQKTNSSTGRTRGLLGTGIKKPPTSYLTQSAKKGTSPKVIETIIQRLKKQRLIDDESFSNWWIEQRQNSRNPKGIRLIRAELRSKGINLKTVNKLLRNSSGPASKTSDESTLAVRAAQKKLLSYRKLPPWEFRRKMLNFLQRRGFTWEIIQETVDKLIFLK